MPPESTLAPTDARAKTQAIANELSQAFNSFEARRESELAAQAKAFGIFCSFLGASERSLMGNAQAPAPRAIAFLAEQDAFPKADVLVCCAQTLLGPRASPFTEKERIAGSLRFIELSLAAVLLAGEEQLSAYLKGMLSSKPLRKALFSSLPVSSLGWPDDHYFSGILALASACARRNRAATVFFSSLRPQSAFERGKLLSLTQSFLHPFIEKCQTLAPGAPFARERAGSALSARLSGAALSRFFKASAIAARHLPKKERSRAAEILLSAARSWVLANRRRLSALRSAIPEKMREKAINPALQARQETQIIQSALGALSLFWKPCGQRNGGAGFFSSLAALFALIPENCRNSLSEKALPGGFSWTSSFAGALGSQGATSALFFEAEKAFGQPAKSFFLFRFIEKSLLKPFPESLSSALYHPDPWISAMKEALLRSDEERAPARQTAAALRRCAFACAILESNSAFASTRHGHATSEAISQARMRLASSLMSALLSLGFQPGAGFLKSCKLAPAARCLSLSEEHYLSRNLRSLRAGSKPVSSRGRL